MLMRLALILIAVLFLASSVHAQPAAKGRVDALGKPLPHGAIARLGTVRYGETYFSAGAHAFAPDGKSVLSVGGKAIIWGVESATSRIQLKTSSWYLAICPPVYSRDGQTALVLM